MFYVDVSFLIIKKISESYFKSWTKCQGKGDNDAQARPPCASFCYKSHALTFTKAEGSWHHITTTHSKANKMI